MYSGAVLRELKMFDDIQAVCAQLVVDVQHGIDECRIRRTVAFVVDIDDQDIDLLAMQVIYHSVTLRAVIRNVKDPSDVGHETCLSHKLNIADDFGLEGTLAQYFHLKSNRLHVICSNQHIKFSRR